MREANKQTLAVIPARGGSKGLPHKNTLSLGGRPLIGWTIEAARKAACIDRVIVSTDDQEIADTARSCGAEVPFMRPSNLASDTATSADVMLHALTMVPGFGSAVLLQPTSPFRTAHDLDQACTAWKNSEATNCVSINVTSESPWLMYNRTIDGQIERLLPMPANGLRRQDLPKAYTLNGAFYFVVTESFLKEGTFLGPRTIGYELPIEHSLDIDTQKDLDLGQKMLSNWGGEIPESVS